MNNFQTKILFNLLWRGCVGGKHTSSDNIIKNFPRCERKKAKKALKKCYNEGYLIVKPTHYGQEVSINPRMLKTIREIPEIREIEEKYRL
jgi:hypothetical protein